MKHFSLPALLFILISTIGFFLIPQYRFKAANKPQKKVPKRDRMDLAWEQEVEMTMDPKLGYVPKERLLEAYQYKQSLLTGLGKAAIPNTTWQERGPNNCGGRTRSILIDLNDPTRKTIWAGSVAGGLWKTTEITVASPNWTPQNDFFDNMAITTITQAPGNTQIMYFGTGEGNNNSDAVRGLGIWKSINGGTSWSQLTATNNSNFHYCQKILAIGNGDTLLAATKNGIYRTVNGGTTFTKVLGTGTSSAGGNEAEDIERASNGTIYVSMSGSGANSGTIHKSYNNGATWSLPLTINGGINKREIELAMAENDTNTIWGLVETSSTIRAVIRSTNAGTSFDTTVAYPNDADPNIPNTDFSRGQAWYDMSIAVDPNNSNVCFVGAVDLFKTTNGGTSWQQISHWYGGFLFQEVHADQHMALFEPGNSNVIYFGNDGGVYRSANATATIPDITPKETNYNTTQFYAADLHPNASQQFFLAGSQDNGSHRFNQPGINSTVEITGGDGAFCHIDQNQPAFQFTSYVYNSYYRSTNGGTSFSGTGLTFGSSTGRFINPTDYDDSLNIMYAAYGNGDFLKWSNPQSGNTNNVVSVTALNSIMVSAVRVSPNTTGRVFFGTSSGRVVRVDNANTATGTVTGNHINSGAGMPSSYVSCIEIEQGNDNHIVVTFSNYGVTSIWETRNGGTTWTNVEGNLPDMPVRWALMNPYRPHQVLIATELGVWSTDSLKGAATDWQPSNSGLSNTRVDMLKTRTSDKLVIAASHGRGLFTSEVFAYSNPNPQVAFIADKTLSYPSANIQFSSTTVGALTYLWDFGDGTTSTSANPIKSYTTSGTFHVTLTVNGGAGTLTKTSYITILPYRGVPYTAANGGNFDTAASDFASVTIAGTGFVYGSSAVSGKSGTFSGTKAWVTGLTGNYADNSEAYLYSPSFNCTVSGTYTLSFYTKYKTEATWDGFRIEYSINNGTTWLPLGTTTSTNWYNYANTSANRPFPQNQAFFSSSVSMTSFAQKSFATTIFSGQERVCFRFAFKSDVSSTDAGVVIDNFELAGPLNNPLPVKFGGFSALRTSSTSARLKWVTYSETNNKGFEVFKKDATEGSWISIGFVNGKVNSNEKNTYSFTDEEAGKNSVAYKLLQKDAGGSSVWSNAVIVPPVIEQQENIISLLYTGDKTFSIRSAGNTQVNLWIYDTHGRQVHQLTLEPGQQTLSLTHLPSGVYYVLAEQYSRQQVLKIPVL